MTYDRQPIRAPRVRGAALRALVLAAEAPLLGPLVRRQMTGRLGVGPFRARDLSEEAPLGRPATPDASNSGALREPAALLAEALGLPRVAGPFASLDDYAAAYREGTTTPEEVAERAVTAVREDEAMDPPLRPLLAQHVDEVRRQGVASAARWARGEPLSPVDGAPVAIKDELHVEGYPTTLGTTFLGDGEVAGADATAVARMRAMGLIVVGKANMHELAITRIPR